MTKHDHWKTTDVDGEDAVYRQERIDAEFCRQYGAFGAMTRKVRIIDGLAAMLNHEELYSLLVGEFDKLTPDQQESFLGMDND